MASINEIVSKDAINGIIDAANSINELNDSLLGLIDSQEKLNEEFQKTQKSTKSTSEKSSEYSKMLNKSAEGQNRLVVLSKELQKQQKALVQTESKLSIINSDANKTLEKKKKSLTETNKVLKLEAVLNDENAGKLEKLRASNKLLQIQKEKLLGTEKDYEDQLKAINDQMDENNDAIKETNNQEQKRLSNIGKYTEGIIDAVKQLKNEATQYKENISALKLVEKSETATKEEREQATLALIENRSALVSVQNELEKYGESMDESVNIQDVFSGGIANIFGNLKELSNQDGGIKGFFKSFVSGIGSATKAGLKFIATPIGFIIAAIVAGIAIFTAAIKRNQEASDGFSAIWGGIKNVFEEVIGRIFKLAGALGKLFKGDLKGAVKEVKASFTGFGEAIQNAYKEGNKLVKMEQDLEKATISATTSQARLNGEIEKSSAIADDATLSFNKRIEASKEASRLQVVAAKESLSLQQQEVDIINLKVEQAERQGRLNRELLQEQADAQAALIEAENAYNMSVFENAKQQRELKSDLYEKDLDILIDGYDNVKTINEQKIANDKYSLEERKKILDETIKLGNDAFLKQTETIQQMTNEQIDINDLLATSDAKQLNDKIRGLGLSEVWEGRLLEVIRERRTVLNDLATAEQDLNDATNESLNEQIENESKLNELKAQQAIELANIQYQQNLLMLKATSKNEEEFARKKFELDKSMALESISNIEWSLQTAEISAEKRIELETQLAQKKLELNQMVADDDEAKAQQQRERLQSIQDDTVAILGSLFQFRSDMLNNEQAELDQQKEAGLISEQDYAKKTAEIELKAAKTARAKALFDIAINTAIAVSKVWGQTGVAGILAQVAPIAMGALQAAAVLSAPLPTVPAFAEGTFGKFNTPLTYVAGEAGPEIVTKSTGQSYVVDKATLFSGHQWKGARITSNPELEKMQSISGHNGFGNSSNTQLISEVRQLNKTMKNKPTWIIDEKSKQIVGMQQNNSVRRIINRYRYEA